MQKYKTVEEFLGSLDEHKRSQIQALREAILTTNPKLSEHIKWNAPSYVMNDEDRITFNTMNKQNVVKLVLHMGATRKEDKKADPIMEDENKLIEWNSNIRGTITFENIDDVQAKLPIVAQITKAWLAL